jgi:hypothetical protein
MTDWVCFEASVEPLVRGRNTYAVLRLPPGAARILQAARAGRVGGEIAGQPVNLALSRAPQGDGLFPWAGQTLLDSLGAKPGVQPEVRPRPAPTDAVDTPEDVEVALRRSGQAEAWQRLTPGQQRGLLHQINTAKTGQTRTRRSATFLKGLTE